MQTPYYHNVIDEYTNPFSNTNTSSTSSTSPSSSTPVTTTNPAEPTNPNGLVAAYLQNQWNPFGMTRRFGNSTLTHIGKDIQSFTGKDGSFYKYNPETGNFFDPQNPATVKSLNDLLDIDGNFRDINGNITANQPLGFMDKYGSAIGLGLNAANGLLSFFNGQQALAQQEDMYEFQKELARANLWNQAQLANNKMDAAARIAAAQEGTISSDGKTVGLTADATTKQYAKDAESRHVKATV